MSSILQAMQEYLNSFPELDALAGGVKVDLCGSEPTSYGVALIGNDCIKRYVNGSQRWQANLVLYALDYSYDDAKRLENAGFCEKLTFWVEDNNYAGIFPELAEGFEPLKVSADNGILYDNEESGDKAIYQIQIHLIYRRNS
jgi:hypothetical protein